MTEITVSTAEQVYNELRLKLAESGMVYLGQYTDEYLALISDDDPTDSQLFPWYSSKSDSERDLLLQAAHRSAYTAGKFTLSTDGEMVVGPEAELLIRLRIAPMASRVVLETTALDEGTLTLLHYWHGEDFVLQEIVRADGIHDIIVCTAQRALETIFSGLSPTGEDVEPSRPPFLGSIDEFDNKRTELLASADRTAFFTLISEDESRFGQFEVISQEAGYFVLAKSENDDGYVIENLSLMALLGVILDSWFGGLIVMDLDQGMDSE